MLCCFLLSVIVLRVNYFVEDVIWRRVEIVFQKTLQHIKSICYKFYILDENVYFTHHCVYVDTRITRISRDLINILLVQKPEKRTDVFLRNSINLEITVHVYVSVSGAFKTFLENTNNIWNMLLMWGFKTLTFSGRKTEKSSHIFCGFLFSIFRYKFVFDSFCKVLLDCVLVFLSWFFKKIQSNLYKFRNVCRFYSRNSTKSH